MGKPVGLVQQQYKIAATRDLSLFVVVAPVEKARVAQPMLNTETLSSEFACFSPIPQSVCPIIIMIHLSTLGCVSRELLC